MIRYAMGEPYPREVAYLRMQLERLVGGGESNDPVMAWAHSLSEVARGSPECAGVGYFDSSGILSVQQGKHHARDDQQRETPKWKILDSLFTPERMKVLHALLVQWQDWRSNSELIETSRAGPNTVSSVLREMQKCGLVQSTGRGSSLMRRITEPEAILDAWARDWAIRRPRRTRWFAASESPVMLANLLAECMEVELNYEWAFIRHSATKALTSFKTPVSNCVIVVPPGATNAIAQHLALRRVDRGFNVTLQECEEFGLQHRIKIKGCIGWYASPVVQYLELVSTG